MHVLTSATHASPDIRHPYKVCTDILLADRLVDASVVAAFGIHYGVVFAGDRDGHQSNLPKHKVSYFNHPEFGFPSGLQGQTQIHTQK